MKTSFTVEQTTTGLKVRAITEKPNGKTSSRVVGRPADYDEADRMIDAFEARLGQLQTV